MAKDSGTNSEDCCISTTTNETIFLTWKLKSGAWNNAHLPENFPMAPLSCVSSQNQVLMVTHITETKVHENWELRIGIPFWINHKWLESEMSKNCRNWLRMHSHKWTIKFLPNFRNGFRMRVGKASILPAPLKKVLIFLWVQTHVSTPSPHMEGPSNYKDIEKRAAWGNFGAVMTKGHKRSNFQYFFLELNSAAVFQRILLEYKMYRYWQA